MNREIKFRIWDKTSKTMMTWESLKKHYYQLIVGCMESPTEDYPIMQFTGLKDKNGKEIYEGDILEVDWNDVRYPRHICKPVKWNEDDACWDIGEGGSPKNDCKYYMEIIGNIYENKDLLK